MQPVTFRILQPALKKEKHSTLNWMFLPITKANSFKIQFSSCNVTKRIHIYNHDDPKVIQSGDTKITQSPYLEAKIVVHNTKRKTSEYLIVLHVMELSTLYFQVLNQGILAMSVRLSDVECIDTYHFGAS